MTRIRRVISGGQTGADRGAWDAALDVGVPIGGWVPAGRWAEDGPIPPGYGELPETAESDVAVRTERNARDSDATLILSHGPPTGGTAWTVKCAQRLRKPCLHLDLARIDEEESHRLAVAWIERHRIERLNIAGPRASDDPAIYPAVRRVLTRILQSP